MNEVGTKTIETERLILRRFTVSDAEGMFYGWASDEKTVKYVNWSKHKSIDETAAILQAWIQDYDKNSFNWAVELKESKELIGNISVISVSKKHNNCEIGYCYGSRYWNRGYATEALKAVVEYLFSKADMHIIEARHRSTNPASGRVMEKAGMKKEAVLTERRLCKDTNTYCDLICYYIKNASQTIKKPTDEPA